MPPKPSCMMAQPVDPSYAWLEDEADGGGEAEDDGYDDDEPGYDEEEVGDDEQEEQADQEEVIAMTNQWMQEQQEHGTCWDLLRGAPTKIQQPALHPPLRPQQPAVPTPLRAQQAASSSSSSSSAVKQEEEEEDPQAWVLDGTWVTEDDSFSNWDKASDRLKAKCEQVSQSRVGESSVQQQMEPIAAAADVKHTAPPWASNKHMNSHLKNNEIKDGSRGSYGFDDNGNQVFLATGHGAFAVGLGRDRPRHRGKGSKAKQRSKTNQDKGKGKAKGKGKSKGKGGSKGDHHFVAAQGQVTQALDTMATMAQSTQQLVTMLAKTEPKTEPETELKSEHAGYDDDEDVHDGWSRSSQWQRRW